jgi:uncharacterized damage-inducible protein DinB
MDTDSTHSEMAKLFVDYSIRRLELLTVNLEECLSLLRDDQEWKRHASHENAIGNIVLHMCGNIRQLIIHGIGGATDERVRDTEFSATSGLSTGQLLVLFRRTIDESKPILSNLTPERLIEPIESQKLGKMAVLETIYRVVGHTQQHMGQIFVHTKQMHGKALALSVPRASAA